MKQALIDKKVQFQLAPPYMHRTNAAERAIRTFKDHFLAGLASMDPNFPMHLWDRLIEQATLTLNLLRPSRLNPHLSAYEFLNGSFNYMSTPIALPGTKVEMHIKPANRPSFGYHSQTGWYLGPAKQHYRCYRIYIPQTSSERIADTVQFFPTRIRMPASSSLDKAIQAANDLIHVLQNPEPASPFFEFGDAQQNALDKLAALFHTSLPPNPNKSLVDDPTQQNIPPSLPRVVQPITVPHQPPAESPRVVYNHIQPTQSNPPPHQYNTRLQ